MNTPLVTVLMPVYNGETFLREAIDCVLAQTFTDFVFLIINDGSTDNTEKIILSYNDSRIQYVRNEENLKLIKTLNKGLSLVTTKYVARMDADDICVPTRLERQVEYMESHSQVGLLGTWCQTIGANEPIVIRYEENHEQICFKQLYQIQIVHPSCMMRMSVLQTLGNWFDETFLHAEDYELFTRMSHVTRLANIPEVLHLYRKHDNAVSVLYNKEQKQNSHRVIAREFRLLGVDINDLQIDSFIALNYQDYAGIALSASEMELLLEEMVLANKTSKYFNDAFLFERLSELWLSYCYESHLTISMYKSSFLSKQISITRTIKWILKNCMNKIIRK
ncbi:MAG: glycosyltransferase [Bacteroidales bacterium]|nr:glycosyltransferase [Bacteroidales bacterium]